ncbi:hypothetical protein MKW94_006743 [Papaver nudicaule]|uniref:FAD dependent oxidoreductase domain-containing protein n=1 Tax=Papaver nudicaule TaxID=74823 RepID=A0AA42B2Q5_PAPNU|nr:hypothetical protein [Papaver nudicaule]
MESVAKKFDVIVIGAGIMGSCTAYQLAKRGKSRTIRCTYPEDYYSQMVLESSKLWEEAEAEIGYRVYFKTRHLDMGVPSDKSLQAVIASCDKLVKTVSNRVLPIKPLHTSICYWRIKDGDAVTSISWIKEKFADKIESAEPVLTQSCMYSMTPDGDFMIDFLAMGRILADMVMNGEAKGVELKYFRLDRFEENPRGNVKDYEDQVNSVKSKL